MSEPFDYDVFLSHSAKDKAVVRNVAERLRQDGVKVWFDEWVLKPGDSIPSKIEEGLERSRVLVLCMSANAFGSDWAQLESGTFRFRDPLNKERRFLPLRLDDAPTKGSLAQFLYINWLPAGREQEYVKLLEACRSPEQPIIIPAQRVQERSLSSPNRFSESPQVELTIGDVNALITASPTSPTRLARRATVWVLGSYSELEPAQLATTRKIVAALGSGFGARRIRLVSGKSDMLDELAASCRNVAMAINPRGPLPIFLDGKLRQTDLRALFVETIGGVPDLAIVIGGGVSRGRVTEECDAAEKASIPVLPVPVTGGAAATVRLTANAAADVYEAVGRASTGKDTNDFVVAMLTAVDRYAPAAEKEKRPIERETVASREPGEPLTRLEINKLVNRYIGVSGGYLGDFSYRTHHDFYLDLDLDIDPYNYDGTTRERFMKIMSESNQGIQARILEGIVDRFPVGSSELRTQERRDEIAVWIARLRR